MARKLRIAVAVAIGVVFTGLLAYGSVFSFCTSAHPRFGSWYWGAGAFAIGAVALVVACLTALLCSALPIKLRVVSSALFGVLIVALCVLWVRSYSRWEDLLYSRDVPWPLYDAWSTRVGSRNGVLYLWQGQKVNLGIHGGPSLPWQVDGKDDCPYSCTNFSWHPPNPDSDWCHDSDAFICVPHWSLMLVATTLGILPWISGLKRFSLRTMFIATTLVAVGLGLGVWLAS